METYSTYASMDGMNGAVFLEQKQVTLQQRSTRACICPAKVEFNNMYKWVLKVKANGSVVP